MINNISILIKPSSSMCNMKCKYCFYFDTANNRLVKNYGIMKKDIIVDIIDKAFLYVGDNGVINFSFQGGEPTLAGTEYFYSFIDYAKNKNCKINYSIQTNGVLIDKDWLKLFKSNNFLVGLSFDILENVHNSYRIDSNGEYTFKKVLEIKNMFDEYNIDYNILTVLTSELTRYPNEVYNEIKKHNIKYIQFIPCLSPISNEENNYYITPSKFAYFYNSIFQLWMNDFLNGEYYSISFFDNIIPMLGGGVSPYTCGLNGRCQSQIVIESNGDIYPCDFYCIDKYKVGNILNTNFFNLSKSNIAKDFINEEKNNTICTNCKFYNICFGGCKRAFNNITDISSKYCGLKHFLEVNDKNILKIWDKIKNNY